MGTFSVRVTVAHPTERGRSTTVELPIDGHETVAPVVFGEPDDAGVLGAVALESLSLIVDPIARRLIPRRFLAL